MRLLGLAVLALVLIGTVLTLGQLGAFNTNVGALLARGETVLDPDRAALEATMFKGKEAIVAPANDGGAIILSSLPSYASLPFLLPRDSRPTEGALKLDYRVNIDPGVEGVLRVNINGVRRAERLLDNRTAPESLSIELTARELASGHLDVTLSLQGRGLIADCPSDESVPAVVTIAPSSGLRLGLDRELHTVQDRLSVWGGRVPVQWTGIDDRMAAFDTLHAAAMLSQKGYRPLLGPDGLSRGLLHEHAIESEPIALIETPVAFPVSLLSDSANTGTRRFYHRVNWRYAYARSAGPDARVPTELNLALDVGPPDGSIRRDLVITLNDRLLASRRLAPGEQTIRQTIALPPEAYRLENEIDISLSARNEQESRCEDISQSVAELLPQTTLANPVAIEPTEIDRVAAYLANADRVSFELVGGLLTSPDAQEASLLLGRLHPASWRPVSDSARAHVRMLSGGNLRAQLEAQDAGPSWIVYREGNEDGQIVARKVLPGDTHALPAVALLIGAPIGGQVVP